MQLDLEINKNNTLDQVSKGEEGRGGGGGGGVEKV